MTSSCTFSFRCHPERPDLRSLLSHPVSRVARPSALGWRLDFCPRRTRLMDPGRPSHSRDLTIWTISILLNEKNANNYIFIFLDIDSAPQSLKCVLLLQSDFGKILPVHGVSTQGHSVVISWVKAYKIAISIDGINFETLKDRNSSMDIVSAA